MSTPLGIVVPGVPGRMGQLLAAAALDDDRHRLVGATARPGSDAVDTDVGVVIGRSACGETVRETLAAALRDDDQDRVVIDFSAPAALGAHLDAAVSAKVPVLVGTTGLEDAHHAALNAAAEHIPVLLAANTSLGANLLSAFAKQAAAALEGAEAEVVELHHRGKKDSPSGTALLLARAIAEGRGESAPTLRTAREGYAPREAAEIGVFGVRGGTVAGEHTAYFFLDDERVELTHRVTDRAIFARGALTAARFLRGRPAGRYTMADVLGLA